MSTTPFGIGTPVDGREGPLGTLAGTRVAKDGQSESYVLVRIARRFGLGHVTRVVPAAWVRPGALGARRLTLDASRAEVAGCPPVRPDAAIQADVDDALTMAGGFFRTATIHATVQDGIVDLTGHAPYRRAAHLAIAGAQAVSGVVAVQDHSVEDGALVIAVAQALTHDPDTRAAHLVVNSRLGTIELNGALPSDVAWQHATALAQAVPGVTSVHNHASLPPVPAAHD